ncbi:transposase [Thiosulfatimonas sediminis]|uniref:Transposase n=2 Tax=Thiosulfatimonas sediminis TaxID=2675054 RepID=A0A6F8PUD0_9GAMM|nr:transposase [Thiosulfatimonas sediminis]
MPNLHQLSADQLRTLAAQLFIQVETQEARLQEKDQRIAANTKALQQKELKIDQLTYELAYLRRLKFSHKSEQISALQMTLLDEVTDVDISAIESELDALRDKTDTAQPKKKPKRQPLPENLPRLDIRHDPESTTCSCGCQLRHIGEDVSEKLDYLPGSFQVERHIRSKWACDACETLIQKPMPPQIIDKGLPTSGLLAHLLIAKYADHLPLYRQAQIFERAGVKLPSSTLAEWVGVCGVQLEPVAQALKDFLLTQPVLHADETPVPMLKPGNKKTHKAYLWAYTNPANAQHKAVYYHFSEGRNGKFAREVLQDWKGLLVCDDYPGYKASFKQGVTEVGCMAHARRKFVELHESGKSTIAIQAIELMGQLYAIEKEIQPLAPEERQTIRQQKSKPIMDLLLKWLQVHREKVPKGGATEKVIHYSLKRWDALSRYLGDGRLPIDNNWVENQIRPWALGRKNWLFAGSLRSGQRAANIMSLIQSAKNNGLDPYAYLKDVLERLPTHKASQIDQLLPHNWQPSNR